MLVSICFNKSNVYIFSSNKYKIEFNTLKWWIVNNTRCFIKHWMKNFTASFNIKGKSEDLQKSVPFMQQNWHKGFICSVAKKNPLITRIFLPNHFSQKMHEHSSSTFYKRNLSKLHRKVKLTLIFCKLWLPCQSFGFWNIFAQLTIYKSFCEICTMEKPE